MSLFHLITHVGIYHLHDDHRDPQTYVNPFGVDPFGADPYGNDHQDDHDHGQHSENPLHADANHCVAGLLHFSEIVSFHFSPKGVFVPEGLVVTLLQEPASTVLLTSVGRAPPAILV